ncbi:adult-specific rigid cuticular protein 15.5-like [Varroa jacobsoni]|uniref:Uncharacterized protein n=1 Tax=Varroa destructor TaxID=109461 RepID=A0A7M7K4Q4_VARDE|nr:adult-specific rigid cuticular protein 15.5-like [Varroa destructor]XP_022707284.1 adult-specific rigid cuticular protein 15.5-like [Varroa jacobsoni]XP_022707285.1 adult-specific rigid cuticular protein 15.5-like [Varroa jacobsoni]
MKSYSILWSAVILYAFLMLLRPGHVTAQDTSRIHESNYRTPHSRNFRSEDGRGNFNFGYDIDDGLGGGQFRRESGNAAGERRGSYGFRGADGRYRIVHWVADHLGFRAAIVSNEPGVASSNPTDASYNGAPLVYSQDTQDAPLRLSGNTLSQYQTTAAVRGVNGPAPAVFATPANAEYETHFIFNR